MDFIIFIVNFIFSLCYLLLALRAVLPWLPHQRQNSFLEPVYQATEPVLSVVRKALPPQWLGVDVSPFVVIVLLWVVQHILVSLLHLV